MGEQLTRRESSPTYWIRRIDAAMDRDCRYYGYTEEIKRIHLADWLLFHLYRLPGDRPGDVSDRLAKQLAKLAERWDA